MMTQIIISKGRKFLSMPMKNTIKNSTKYFGLLSYYETSCDIKVYAMELHM